jgi:hypothetical protein
MMDEERINRLEQRVTALETLVRDLASMRVSGEGKQAGEVPASRRKAAPPSRVGLYPRVGPAPAGLLVPSSGAQCRGRHSGKSGLTPRVCAVKEAGHNFRDCDSGRPWLISGLVS